MIFKDRNNTLVGEYLDSTNGKEAKSLILFVHGDGESTYNQEGYYDIIWNKLREKGYAVYSWNKAGIAGSSGNWLLQSMQDRQIEVRAAIKAVQEKYKFTNTNTGLLGFSQAGWVVPALADDSLVSFIIGIGFASNWISQGEYYTRVKHTLKGASKKSIEKAIRKYKSEIDFLKTEPSYSEYLEFEDIEHMSKDRFSFALKNIRSDAINDYERIKVKSLFIWGENDLNVDAKIEFSYWQNKNNKLITTKLISNASHAMLDSNRFNKQIFTFTDWLKLMWYEEEAFNQEFLPTLILWLEDIHN